jgi:hypothetical protein
VISLANAQIGAQVASLIVFGLLAVWFAAPFLKALGRSEALIVAMSVHIFRYVTLITFSAQHDGYPISDIAAIEAVFGDVIGAGIAVMAIGFLHVRWYRLGVASSWLLVFATAADFAVGIHRKALEPLWGAASGLSWFVLNFYVPLIMVSLPVLIWQLCARYGEAFNSNGGPEVGAGPDVTPRLTRIEGAS